MKYFFDTEFIEDGKTIDMISIGIVNESGDRTLYLQNSECAFERAGDWVWRNVFPHLIHFDMRGRRGCRNRENVGDSGLSRTSITTCGEECFWATHREIKEIVLKFCDPDKHGKPEFWGYYSDYDWVIFCQLFGTMMQLPKGFPMYCRDLKQLLDEKGNPRFQNNSPHNALDDAKWVMNTYSEVLKLPFIP